jgi:glyoxylase-like metal-dependent hydrolase (beta-lactamase superfamily II)
VGDINTYLILPAAGSDELVLVDTGVRSDEAWEALGAGLASVGRRVEDITRVQLTHAHPDHFGQAARVARTAGCEVWAHELAQNAIDRYAQETPPERLDRVRAFLCWLGVPEERAKKAFGPPGGTSIVEHVVPDVTFGDGDHIDIAGFPLEVLHTPGHCPEEVVFWNAESGAMLSGDHLLPDITPVCLFDVPVEPGGERVRTLVQYMESLDKVERLRVRLLLPSHGDTLPGLEELLARYRLATETRALKIARLLQKGDATPFDLAVRMFPRLWDAQLHLVLSEVLGHLDLLELRGNVTARESAGVMHYQFSSLPSAGAA